MWDVHGHSIFITGFMDPFHYRSIWAKLMKDLVLYRIMKGVHSLMHVQQQEPSSRPLFLLYDLLSYWAYSLLEKIDKFKRSLNHSMCEKKDHSHNAILVSKVYTTLCSHFLLKDFSFINIHVLKMGKNVILNACLVGKLNQVTKNAAIRTGNQIFICPPYVKTVACGS